MHSLAAPSWNIFRYLSHLLFFIVCCWSSHQPHYFLTSLSYLHHRRIPIDVTISIPHPLHIIISSPLASQTTTSLTNPLPSLLNLTMGPHFYRTVNYLSSSFQTLTFRHYFDQPVDQLPASLLQVSFGEYLNQPVDYLLFNPATDTPR